MRTDLIYIFSFYFLFLAEYLAAVALFCFRFPKRKLFWLRLAASLALCCGLALIWAEWMGAYIPLVILRYLLLFCGAFISVLFCFDVSALTALFSATCGYALQHFAQVCASALFHVFLEREGAKYWALFIYFFLFVFAYAAGYLLFAARIKEAERVLAREKCMLWLSMTVLFCVVVLSAVYDTNEEAVPGSVAFVCGGFEAMCSLLSLGLMLLIFRIKKTEYEMHGLQVLWEQEKQQYKMTKDRVDLINIKCHDMKKYIAQLADGGKVSAAEVSELGSLVSLYDRAVHTGSEVIDVLLADKGLSCEKEGVRLSCMVDGAKFSFMTSADLYSLFGNIVDNAVTAAAALPERDRRVVSITSSVSAGMLFLHEENYFAGDVRMEAGIPQTSTGDEAHHGFGTRSIAYVAKKYGGEAHFAAKDGIFSVDVVLPLPKPSS